MLEERIGEVPTTAAEMDTQPEEKEEGPISTVEVEGQSGEREEGPTSTDVTDKQISIGETSATVSVPQEEKPQEQNVGIEQVQVQEKPIISKGKPKRRRITSYLSNISKQVEKQGNQINKMTIMIQSLQKQKQKQSKSITGTGVDKLQFQTMKQINSQISQLQKQVIRIQNDIQRIKTAPITRTITRLKSKSRKQASSPISTVKPRSKKSKSLMTTKVKKGRKSR